MAPVRLFIAGAREHTGKTTCALPIISGLKNMGKRVGYFKPVGQRFEPVGDRYVDQDVCLMKEFFQLPHQTHMMGPVVIPPGYTRDYVDGKVSEKEQIDAIQDGFDHVARDSDIVLIEGTGHVGVGSIVNMNNARVAQLLGADMILVASGGLGRTFDEIELNRALCEEYGVKIRGVILNKIQPEKLEMVRSYFEKLLKRWGVPLLAAVPDEPFIGYPTLRHVQQYLNATFVSGARHVARHYPLEDTTLLVTDLRRFNADIEEQSQERRLYVTHCSRDDIILGFLSHNYNLRIQNMNPEAALLLCGHHHNEDFYRSLQDTVQGHDFPVLTVPHTTHKTLNLLDDLTPKLHYSDLVRVDAAIRHYEPFIDFDTLLEP